MSQNHSSDSESIMPRNHFWIGLVLLSVSIFQPLFLKDLSDFLWSSEGKSKGGGKDVDGFLGILETLGQVLDLSSAIFVIGGTLGVTIMTFHFDRLGRVIKYIFKRVSIRKGKSLDGPSVDYGAERDEIYEIAIALADGRYKRKPILGEVEKLRQKNSIGDNPIDNNPENRIETMFTWIEKYFIEGDGDAEENQIKEVLSSHLAMRELEANEDIETLEFMEQAAPAFGVAGTVFGLVLLLGGDQTDNINALLYPMSIALLTTLYGVLLANAVFAPAITKRTHLKDTTVLSYSMIRDAIIFLKRREHKADIAERLLEYLPYDVRSKKEKSLNEEYRKKSSRKTIR